MEKNLKKIGVMFLVLTAVMFGALIGLFAKSPLVSVTTLVIIAACLFIAHFLITKKMDVEKHTPIELIIILYADIVFGIFAGALIGYINGLIAFYILFLKTPKTP